VARPEPPILTQREHPNLCLSCTNFFTEDNLEQRSAHHVLGPQQAPAGEK
jgi:hypothetical protein